MSKTLDKIYNTSNKLSIDDDSKIVIMSDCHRGTGDKIDNFLKNKNIYKAALDYYYNRGFTYIELGDGDEMWEVDDFSNVIEKHLDVFKQIKKFYDLNRLIMIYGNHDIYKRIEEIMSKYFYKYYDTITNKNIDLLDGLVVYESFVLNYKVYDLFLIHGHQVDFLNGKLWKLSRFLVRKIWKKMEYGGIKDPTNNAKNHYVEESIEKKLKKWSIKKNRIIVAGHTHRPIFPKTGDSLYFNDGSCIHPNGITCIEIENGNISLVKWEFKSFNNNFFITNRVVLGGNEPIVNFFKKKTHT